jgi:hypothetical protein
MSWKTRHRSCGVSKTWPASPVSTGGNGQCPGVWPAASCSAHALICVIYLSVVRMPPRPPRRLIGGFTRRRRRAARSAAFAAARASRRRHFTGGVTGQRPPGPRAWQEMKSSGTTAGTRLSTPLWPKRRYCRRPVLVVTVLARRSCFFTRSELFTCVCPLCEASSLMLSSVGLISYWFSGER